MTLLIFAHGALGFWDETIYFILALLFTLLVSVIWRLSRGFKPTLEGDEQAESDPDSRETAHHAGKIG